MEITPFLGQLASAGLLGVLLVLSLIVNWYLFRTIQDLNEKRIQDAKDMSDKILEPIDQIKRNAELLITLFQNFLRGRNSS